MCVKQFGVFLATVMVAAASMFLLGCSQTKDQGSNLSVSRTDALEAPVVIRELEPSTPVTPTPTPVLRSTPAPTATPILQRRATLVFTGDILSHGSVIQRAALNGAADRPYDFAPMLSQVRNILEIADFAICHLETPISSDNAFLSGYPVFNAPKELPLALHESGYDACSTASNHSMDKGAEGVVSTLNQLEKAELGWAGMARSAEEAAAPTLYSVQGITIGHLSYTYGLNGFVLPADQPYLVNVIDAKAILAEAASARAAGADFIVLSIQWGNAYQEEPSVEQLDLAEELLASSDIDLIVGSHVHVVQPIGMQNGKYVIYGLGNFLSNQSVNCCPAASQNGLIAFVDISGSDLEGFAVSDLSFIPTRVDRADFTIVPLTVALQDEALDPHLRDLYENVIEETSTVVNKLGGGFKIKELTD